MPTSPQFQKASWYPFSLNKSTVKDAISAVSTHSAAIKATVRTILTKVQRFETRQILNKYALITNTLK